MLLFRLTGAGATVETTGTPVSAEAEQTQTPVPAPPWWQPKRRGDASKAPLTRDAIVEAAVKLLQREGVDAVSMRGVAAELGTAAGSLYWHLRGKDELLMLVYDRVMGEVHLPPHDPEHWQQQLRDLGHATRRVLRRHRDLARLALGRIPTGPNMVRLMEWLLTLLRRAGVPDERLGHVGDHYGQFVAAYVYEETLHQGAIEAGAPAAVQEYFASLPPDAFPTLSQLAPLVLAGDADERFDFGLDLLIGGIERLIERARQQR